MCKSDIMYVVHQAHLVSVFVNGRDRSTIMEDMQSRIDRRNISLERADAIKAMCEIAADRARKLQP